MNPQTKIPILVVGSSGRFGCQITHELLSHPEHFAVSILVRDPSKCQETCDKIQKSGGRVITGDVIDPNSIRDATKGIHTVISALEGDESILLKGQMNLLQDGIKNDIKRFVPSDFSLNFWNLPLGTNYCVDQSLRFRQCLEKEKVKGLYFTVGTFMECYFSYVEKEGFWYWDNINRKIDLTSINDVAKFVAAAVRDPNLFGDVMVYSTQMSVKEINEAYNHITGKNLELKNMGSINELRDRIKNEKQQGNTVEALKLGYYYLLFGENTLITNRMNEKFPDVKVTPLEEFLDKTEGKPAYDLPLSDIAKKISKEALLQYSI